MRSSGSFLKCITGLLAGLLVLGAVSVAFSGLSTIGDQDLAAITGQSGVSIYEDLYTIVTIDSLKLYDSGEVGSVEFRNLTIDKDGTGAPFQIYTPTSIASPNQIVDMPITFDIGTNSTSRTIVQLVDSSGMSPRTYTVGGFFFCGQELGDNDPTKWSLQLAGLEHKQPDILHFGAHADGSVGIDFDYSTQLYASSFQYNYNNTGNAGGALVLSSGINLAGSATGDPKYPLGHTNTGPGDPDPTTPPWTFSGYFKVGNIVTNPASMDVATNNADPSDTALFFNLPISGSLRIGDVNFGGNDFGPIAIDGINAHHLFVKISTK